MTAKITRILSPFLISTLLLTPALGEEKKSEKKKVAKKEYPATESKKKESGKTPFIPKPLLEIEKKYVGAKTLEAEFTQVSHVQMTGAKKESSGMIMLTHPNKFRWETLKPDKNLLVTDGKKFWFYTPPFVEGERGQVIEKKTAEVQSEMANLLLSGAFSKVKDVTIEQISETKYKLHPKLGVAGTVKVAEIEINPKKSLIENVRLEHDGGNKVEIKLAKIKLGEKMDEGFFRFVTPPGTDVIKE